MSRTPKTELVDRMQSGNSPRLVVLNSSTSAGRYPQMFRIRPTLLKRARETTVGPLYIVLEHALEKLLLELSELPAGTLRSVNAMDYDPTAEDYAALESTSPAKIARQSRKAVRDAGTAGFSDAAAAVCKPANK